MNNFDRVLTFGFFTINNSAKSVRSNKNKRQFLIIIIIQILQVRLIRDDQHFLECVFFIRYLTHTKAGSRSQLLDLSDLPELLIVKWALTIFRNCLLTARFPKKYIHYKNMHSELTLNLKEKTEKKTLTFTTAVSELSEAQGPAPSTGRWAGIPPSSTVSPPPVTCKMITRHVCLTVTLLLLSEQMETLVSLKNPFNYAGLEPSWGPFCCGGSRVTKWTLPYWGRMCFGGKTGMKVLAHFTVTQSQPDPVCSTSRKPDLMKNGIFRFYIYNFMSVTESKKKTSEEKTFH